jgi:hypothetical protein
MGVDLGIGPGVQGWRFGVKSSEFRVGDKLTDLDFNDDLQVVNYNSFSSMVSSQQSSVEKQTFPITCILFYLCSL